MQISQKDDWLVFGLRQRKVNFAGFCLTVQWKSDTTRNALLSSMKDWLNHKGFWALLAAIFFLPFLGGVHLFDWDEINFAELAREMVVSGDWLKMQINYAEFTEKPPLFFWLQASSMELFGVGDYAARFPNAVLGIIVLPGLYQLGKFLVDQKFGILWALSWFGSTLPFLYFKSGIIDPFFNFFIFTGLLFLILASWSGQEDHPKFRLSKTTMLWIGGAAVGLGILTKGPVAYLLVFLTTAVYILVRRGKMPVKLLQFIGFSAVALLTFVLWFAIDFLFRGPDFLIEFTIRQWELLTTGDAGHSGFIGYHFVVLFFGCFPASIFAISSLRKAKELPNYLRDFQLWMVILFWVVLILFSLVGTKIIHYSSMAYYPITFLSALSIWCVLSQKRNYASWWNVGLGFVGAIMIIVSVALPYLGMHPETLIPLLSADPFAQANMNAEVNWSIVDYVPGILALAVLIGYYFNRKKNFSSSIKILFFGNGVWVFAALIFFVAKVESISQRANVEFFESCVGEEVYVTTYGYKSYVPWYYARIQPHQNDSATDGKWLLYGETDLPVRISVKINKVEEFEERIPDAVLLYEKNGFYFFERPAFSK